MPWRYDENGVATDADTIDMINELEEDLDMVKHFERSEGRLPLLSDVWGDQAGQDLATAMTYFTVVGKHGFYNNLFEVHKDRWGSKSDGC